MEKGACDLAHIKFVCGVAGIVFHTGYSKHSKRWNRRVTCCEYLFTATEGIQTPIRGYNQRKFCQTKEILEQRKNAHVYMQN